MADIVKRKLLSHECGYGGCETIVFGDKLCHKHGLEVYCSEGSVTYDNINDATHSSRFNNVLYRVIEGNDRSFRWFRNEWIPSTVLITKLYDTLLYKELTPIPDDKKFL